MWLIFGYHADYPWIWKHIKPNKQQVELEYGSEPVVKANLSVFYIYKRQQASSITIYSTLRKSSYSKV